VCSTPVLTEQRCWQIWVLGGNSAKPAPTSAQGWAPWLAWGQKQKLGRCRALLRGFSARRAGGGSRGGGLPAAAGPASFPTTTLAQLFPPAVPLDTGRRCAGKNIGHYKAINALASFPWFSAGSSEIKNSIKRRPVSELQSIQLGTRQESWESSWGKDRG